MRAMADMNLRNIPDRLTREVKSQAALRGKTMRQFVIEALEKTIQEVRRSPKSTRGKVPRKQ